MKKRSIATVLLILLALLVVACAKKATPVQSEATSYGAVYGHYVCAVSVRQEDGVIQSVVFEEAEAPYSWARIANITTSIEEDDKTSNTEYTGSGTNHVFAKKIRIADVIFEARDNGESNNYVDYFNADKNGEVAFETWLESSDNAKWYFQSISAGDYDVLKQNGDAYDVTFKASSNGELNKSERWLKSKNGYWPASDTRKGWQANMNAMADYIKAHGFSAYEAHKSTLDPEGNEIEINGVKTGATVVYFKDYMDIASKANNAATQQFESKNQNTVRANIFLNP